MTCLFCDIADKKRPSSVVYEDPKVFAFRDIHPQAPSHILVIPRKHISTLDAIGEEDGELMGHVLLKAGDIARQEGLAGKGYRVVINCNPWGGQAVYHLHFHLLGGRPFRWPPG